jgi:hypothetical protein
MASAYLFAMLAVTPSKSREVALIANPEFEAGRVAGHNAHPDVPGIASAAKQSPARLRAPIARPGGDCGVASLVAMTVDRRIVRLP